MKAIEIRNSYLALKTLREKTLPGSMALVILRNIRKMEDVMSDMEKTRNDIIDRYAERDEDGNLITDGDSVKVTDVKSCTEELENLGDTEIDITLDTVRMSDFEKCGTDKYDALTLDEVMGIELMLEKETEE